jgi:hypothetical protein
MPGIESSAAENLSAALPPFLTANSWVMLVPCLTEPKSYWSWWAESASKGWAWLATGAASTKAAAISAIAAAKRMRMVAPEGLCKKRKELPQAAPFVRTAAGQSA